MVAGSHGHKAPSLSVTYSCHVTSSMDQDIHSSDFNFNSPCPFGLESVVFFPPCWDGVNLHKSDNSHMAYPLANDARDAPCPISHPVKLPSIQMEYTWTMSVNKSANLAGNLIWSNGDTTGYGLHADFVNGWVPGVLGAALNDSTCNTGASM